MFKALHTAATGMYAQQRNVEVVANNLANVNTTAYKRSDVVFADLLYVNEREPGAQTAAGGTMAGLQVGSGAAVIGTSKNFRQGDPIPTGNPFDLAIGGEGFFEVENPGGQPLYTRAGNFSVDRDGVLTTPSGRRLVNGPSGLGNARNVTVTRDGRVSGLVDGVEADLGQIQIATFFNPAGLVAEGDNLYRANEVSGAATLTNPEQNGAGSLLQEHLERSNVDIANELINLILAQRAYETNSRAINTADQMMATANQVAR
ncbi:MAG TPA: flagellar basal-body rod protein FlgG [Planctomycetota bacterium]|nr:flagellar basal-body rod protein FlgG [Planctomycetota bacterium]